MRSHSALYVDVGYLIASAATRATGTSYRSGVKVDHEPLISGLIDQVETLSKLPLLRVNWYDSGARAGGVPDETQEAIGMLPRVKLRLGRRGVSGEQKGVDVRLGLDLATHARNRVADVMYLVSGDDDLTEAVEEAQGHGIQVVVLAVPNSEGRPHAVSRHLQRAADGVELIDAATLDAAVRQLPTAPATEPAVEAVAGTTPVPAIESQAIPTPADVARLAVPRPASPPSPTGQPSSGSLVFSSRTGADGQHWQPDVVDEDLVEQVCEAVLKSWLSRASYADRQDLRASRPSIPGDIDRALLLDLSERSGIYDLPEDTRFLLRKRFWEQVDKVI
jgi:uncharacterized LabA/DUF88 family protein